MTLIIKKTKDTGKGAFSDRAFEAKDIIIRFPSKNLTTEQVSKLDLEKQKNVLQIGLNNYLDLEKESVFFINHSCNPNCYVKIAVNIAFLIALRPIKKDEELTFDYSVTSTDTEDTWQLKCNCHKFYCRKNISGFNTLKDSKKKELLIEGVVPGYIKG